MIRFGVAGWDYKDWWGRVYPAAPPRHFDPLEYLSRYFDTVEVNSTFYGAGTPKAARSWVARVGGNARFRFTAKLWKRFTHEREEAWSPAEVELVRTALAPIAEAGKLGTVLAQFPWSFRKTPENEEWLDDALRAFRDFPMAVEVRHSSWNDPGFYQSLSDRGVGIVNIDQPVFRNSIIPGTVVTTPSVGYVRLHGRNYENWFRDEAESHERYDYMYTEDELKTWLDRIREVAQQAQDTYVITNNHYLGQAPANAAMLRRLSGDADVTVPPELEAAFGDVLKPLGIHAGAGDLPGQAELGL